MVVNVPTASTAGPALKLVPGVSISVRSGTRPHCVIRTGNSNFLRIGVREYAFLSLVDGKRTVQEIVDRLGAKDEFAISAEEGPRIAAWLAENHVVAPVGSAERSGRDQAGPHRGGGLSNPVFARVPLFDPDALLERLTPLVGSFFGRAGIVAWGLVGVFAAIVYATGGIDRSVPNPFEGANWVVFALAWLGLKIVHEFGHGVACKRYGGDVHEMGLVLILFSPIAYVDVSSSWGFRSRWARIHTALAGLQAETFVAFVAVLAAAACRSETWSGAFLGIAFVGGLVSVLVNLNPFMRLDGYHVASELLSHPNLYAESQRWLRAVAGRVLLGPGSLPRLADFRRRMLLTVYGLLALGFRLSVYTGLVLAAAWMLHGFGLVLAVVALVCWPGIPLFRLMLQLVTGQFGGWSTTLRGLVLSVGLGSVLIGVVASLPWPFGSSAPGIVDYEEAVRVHAETSGFVEQVEVVAGQFVEQGDVLVVLKNPEAESRVRELESRLRDREFALRRAIATNDVPGAETAREELSVVRAEYEFALERCRNLLVRAPVDGRVLTGNVAGLLGIHAEEGDELLEIGDPRSKVFVAVVSERQAEVLADRVGDGTVRLWGRRAVSSSSSRVEPRASLVPGRPELTSVANGPLTVTPRRNESGGSTTGVTHEYELARVEVRTSLPLEFHGDVRVGETGTFSWNGRGERIGEAAVRWCRKLLERPRGS